MGNTVVLYGCSEEGMTEYRYLVNVFKDAEFLFCQTEKTCDIFEGFTVISLKELYDLDKNETKVYVYDDYERCSDKRERLKLAGFKNIYSCTPGMENYYNIIWNVPDIKQELAELFDELFIFIYCKEDTARLKRMHDRVYILNNIVRISDAYNLLEDEASRTTFRDVLRYRITGDDKFLKRNMVLPQYFCTDIFEFSDHEIFVDGGACQGDSVIDFMNFVDNKYDKIYAYEVNKNYYLAMEALFENSEIQLFKKGLYSHETKLYFLESAHGSRVLEEPVSDESIEVTSIDESIDGEVTFIKMDIEGSELKALEGATKTIQRCKPKLAICAYHKENDLWEVPLKIKEILPEYKIYMRQHYDVLDEETVCYARI